MHPALCAPPSLRGLLRLEICCIFGPTCFCVQARAASPKSTSPARPNKTAESMTWVLGWVGEPGVEYNPKPCSCRPLTLSTLPPRVGSNPTGVVCRGRHEERCFRRWFATLLCLQLPLWSSWLGYSALTRATRARVPVAELLISIARADFSRGKWTHWGLNPGPPAC